jgi:hypothetical protein
MEINICAGKSGFGRNKDFPEIAKIEIESLDEYLQKRDLLNLIREKMNNPKAMIHRTVFDSKNKNLFVYLY